MKVLKFIVFVLLSIAGVAFCGSSGYEGLNELYHATGWQNIDNMMETFQLDKSENCKYDETTTGNLFLGSSYGCVSQWAESRKIKQDSNTITLANMTSECLSAISGNDEPNCGIAAFTLIANCPYASSDPAKTALSVEEEDFFYGCVHIFLPSYLHCVYKNYDIDNCISA